MNAVDAIRDLAAKGAKATEGPWLLMPEQCGRDGQVVLSEPSMGVVCEVGDPYPRGPNKPQESMEFIVAAHKALEFMEPLCRAVEAAQAYVEADETGDFETYSALKEALSKTRTPQDATQGQGSPDTEGILADGDTAIHEHTS